MARLGEALVALLVGALCAHWFARMMRSFRPQVWPDASGKPATRPFCSRCTA